MAREIFISYSRRDLARVKQIKDAIEAATGADCWMDLEGGIDAGNPNYKRNIIKGINSCGTFLFVLSEKSQESENAKKELDLAYKKHKEEDKHVVIVNIDGCQMTDEFYFDYGVADTIRWGNAEQRDKLFRYLVKWTAKEAVNTGKPKEPKIQSVHEDDEASKAFTVNGVSFKMIYVEGGTFQMGKSADGVDVTPVHDVTLRSYYIGQTQVTQALWKAVMENNPGPCERNNLPVVLITWDDCHTFITKLNSLTGKKFRLPNEAEWEFAAKGGTKSKGYTYSGSHLLGNVAWYYDNSGYMTHPVAQKQPNELGIYDMSGNVSEWCIGQKDSCARSGVWRGGCFFDNLSGCLAVARTENPEGPTFGSDRLGLRLVLPE